MSWLRTRPGGFLPGAILVIILAARPARPDGPVPTVPVPAPAPVAPALAPARQVTLLGVRAIPKATTTDSRLKALLPQLNRLLPGHGFTLVKIEGQRATAGERVRCDLGDGFTASSEMVTASDDQGKIRMRFVLTHGRDTLLRTEVTTPPDQILFCEKPLADGSKLLVGLAAR